ncbi:hypothetical protein POVWA2_007490 [Plasmodium ovale wallikeri]|uniref:Uncharacterized protein n=1 Tax=Plasmodium ovale wallikeri TaxID=864142 RepID=A0A1A8YIY1_PLAOA|nr:hypothetical protein POVWA1_007350 [Plasmodium ovale wallikeri]SBT32057.1 hypothetical protein POVWA2_007490 [Plasmodium ovale wallikeri]
MWKLLPPTRKIFSFFSSAKPVVSRCNNTFFDFVHEFMSAFPPSNVHKREVVRESKVHTGASRGNIPACFSFLTSTSVPLVMQSHLLCCAILI